MATSTTYQSLTARPSDSARKRLVAATYSSEMMLQMLATRSAHANVAPASFLVARARATLQAQYAGIQP